MDIIFQKHESALKENDSFAWISISNNGYEFIQTHPGELASINRYLIERFNFKNFINQLSRTFHVYSCISLGKGAQHLTKVQFLYLKKQIISNGWTNLQIEENSQAFLRNAITYKRRTIRDIGEYLRR